MKGLIRYLIGILIFLFNPVFSFSQRQFNDCNLSGRCRCCFHAPRLSPGFGDPSNIQLEKCATQQILDNLGRQQAMAPRAELRRNQTFFAEVLSSDWFLCKEMTELLNSRGCRTFSGLNSFF